MFSERLKSFCTVVIHEVPTQSVWLIGFALSRVIEECFTICSLYVVCYIRILLLSIYVVCNVSQCKGRCVCVCINNHGVPTMMINGFSLSVLPFLFLPLFIIFFFCIFSLLCYFVGV